MSRENLHPDAETVEILRLGLIFALGAQRPILAQDDKLI